MYKILVALLCIALVIILGGICIHMHDYLIYLLKSALPILPI